MPFFNLLPEKLANPFRGLFRQLRCIYRNCFINKDFKQYYQKGVYEFKFNNGLLLLGYRPDFQEGFGTELNGYFAHATLKTGDIVVDAGAYLGSFAIYASKIVGDEGKIIAFEPDPENYRKLQQNIKLNGVKNIILINKGLSSENTELYFYAKGTTASAIVQLSEKNISFNQNIIKISVVRLDDELDQLNIKNIDFIKMDIEGVEIEALIGCKNLLLNNSVNLAIASYHIINGTQTYICAEKILKNFGYNVKTDFPEHLTTYGWKK